VTAQHFDLDAARPTDAPKVGQGAARSIDAKGSALITVDILRGERLRQLDLQPYWQDLVTRAETPNVFMSPAVIAAAAAVDPSGTRASATASLSLATVARTAALS
jgi:hypothetical protein